MCTIALEEESYKKRRTVALIASVVMVLSILAFALFVPHTNADPITNGIVSGAGSIPWGKVADAEGYGLVGPLYIEKDELDEDHANIIANQLANTNPFRNVDSILSSGFYEVVTAPGMPGNVMMNAMKVFAAGICIIYGFVHAFQAFAREELNLNMSIKIIIHFIIGFMMILYIDDMITVVDGFGLAIKERAASVSEESVTTEIEALGGDEAVETESGGNTVGDFLKGVWKHIKGVADGLFSPMKKVVSMIKSLILMLVLRISAMFICYMIAAGAYGLYFSLCLRRAFMPLAIADISVEGIRSPGFRYIKGYLGLYIEMAYYYIVTALSTVMLRFALINQSAAKDTNTVFGVWGACYCILVATRVMVRQSGTVANRVMGT